MTEKNPNSPPNSSPKSYLDEQDLSSHLNLSAKTKRNIHIHGKRTTMVLANGFWKWFDQQAKELSKPLDEVLEMLPYGDHINFSDMARLAAILTSMEELKQARQSRDELRDVASQFPSIYQRVCDDLKQEDKAALKKKQNNYL